MPADEPDETLRLGLLDRLMDDEPGLSREVAPTRAKMLRDFRASVRRDLESLLNARCDFVDVPPALERVRASGLLFGLPDFATYNTASVDGQRGLARLVQRQIKLFEPRLAQVEVTIVPSPNKLDRAINFRIEAMLRTDPVPEPVLFDTVRTDGGRYEVRGGD